MKFKVLNGGAVMTQFEKLQQKMLRKSLTPALRKAATPMLQEARRQAPVKTGTLRKALSKRPWQNPSAGRCGVVVGVNQKVRIPTGRNKPRFHIPAKYLHLVIRGTAEHTAADGQVIPSAPPNDFLSRAKQATQSQARDILAREFPAMLKKATSAL